MKVSDLVTRFESLGDNCEFGFFQRYCGAEPLGFFRFNWTGLDPLLCVLENQLADVDSPTNVSVVTGPESPEFFVKIQKYGFSYHTEQFSTKTTADRVLAQQIRAIAFLKRKFLEDLRNGEKTFVRKGPDTAGMDDAQRLHAALSRHGRNHLLWVVPENEMRSRGTVEVVQPGLLKGYIDRFAPNLAAADISPCWLDVCRHAHALNVSECKPGTVLQGPQDRRTTNLLRGEYLERDRGWSGRWIAPTVTMKPCNRQPPAEAVACQVAEFTLTSSSSLESATILVHKIPTGLSPDTSYVASAFVYLPTDADLDTVDIIIPGITATLVRRADLSLRDQWQRIWTCGRLRSGQSNAAPGLFVLGRASSQFLATGWQFEIGFQPSEFVANSSGALNRA